MGKGHKWAIYEWLMKKPTSQNEPYLSFIRLAVMKGVFAVESLRVWAAGVDNGTYFPGGQPDKISKSIHAHTL